MVETFAVSEVPRGTFRTFGRHPTARSKQPFARVALHRVSSEWIYLFTGSLISVESELTPVSDASNKSKTVAVRTAVIRWTQQNFGRTRGAPVGTLGQKQCLSVVLKDGLRKRWGIDSQFPCKTYGKPHIGYQWPGRPAF